MSVLYVKMENYNNNNKKQQKQNKKYIYVANNHG